MAHIEGPALIGFGDFFSGYDDVGAVKKPAAKAPGGKPSKRPLRPYPKPARTATVQHHGKVLKKSRDVATKAAKTIGLAMHLLSRKPAAVTAKPMSAKATAVVKALPGRAVHVGAAVAAKMTPKAQLAVTKHNDAVAKAKKAGQVLAQHAIKTRDAVKVLAKKMVAQKKTSKLLRTPLKKRTAHVGALLADPATAEATIGALQEYYDAVGAAPDPANPGYLDDGSPDPAAAPAPAPSDADLGIPMDTAGDVVDSGAELPAPPPMSQFISDMNAVGGIAYDGSKGKPNGFVGSYNMFTGATYEDAPGGAIATMDEGTNYFGYVWGSFDRDNIPGGIPYGGRLEENQWNRIFGRYVRGASGSFNEVVSEADALASAQKTAPNSIPYGPLVGNPNMPDFKAMRVDAAGNMFWLPQEAPDWLTFPMKQAAALTAQAAAKAEAEAAKAAAAAEAKARADEAAAQAAQNAANALAESAAASTQKIAKGEEEVKQATAETQAQEALVRQQAEDTTAQAVETEQTKQAGTLMLSQAAEQAMRDKQVADMLVEQAKREQLYYAQHPDEEFAPTPAETDTDEGSDEQMEDGEPIPGGDVMHDADGEGYQGDED